MRFRYPFFSGGLSGRAQLGGLDRPGEKGEGSPEKADQDQEVRHEALPVGRGEGCRQGRIGGKSVVEGFEGGGPGSEEEGQDAGEKKPRGEGPQKSFRGTAREAREKKQKENLHQKAGEEEVEVAGKEGSHRLPGFFYAEVEKEGRGDEEGHEKRPSRQEDQNISVDEPENAGDHHGPFKVRRAGERGVDRPARNRRRS